MFPFRKPMRDASPQTHAGFNFVSQSCIDADPPAKKRLERRASLMKEHAEAIDRLATPRGCSFQQSGLQGRVHDVIDHRFWGLGCQGTGDGMLALHAP